MSDSNYKKFFFAMVLCQFLIGNVRHNIRILGAINARANVSIPHR
nr:MAG TPA: hypothetical protein [Bacteriophage sp.]